MSQRVFKKWLCLALISGAGIAGSARAETAQLKFEDEICAYSLPYSPGKDDKAAIEATAQFLAHDNTRPGTPHVFKPEDISQIDIAVFDRQCAESVASLSKTMGVGLEGLEDYRKALIAETQDYCRYGRAEMLGYTDPTALRNYEPARSCSIFIDALEGKSDLLAMHDRVAREACVKNTSPTQCLTNFKAHRGDKRWTQIDVQNFGWTHCAVSYLKINTEKNDKKRRKLFALFLKKYKVKKLTCQD